MRASQDPVGIHRLKSALPEGASAPIGGEMIFMDRALKLAERGVALASPNPMVGAVLVRDGQVVGEGFHTYEGVRHAEIIALDAAGEAARGATLYINLEPCCHTGRTRPCTQALVAAGVARVVAAMPDPNARVSGRGFEQLRAAGIEVRTGLREAEARHMNEAFARWIVSRKPLVTLKSALTLDGQLVLPHQRSAVRTVKRKGARHNGRAQDSRSSRDNRWISSPESRAEVQRMRHASDALLTGIGTVLVDDPLLTDRTGFPRRRKLLRVVMDSHLRLLVRSKLVASADHDLLVFTRASENSAKARALRRAGVEIVRLRGRAAQPDLAEAIAELGRREILSVLLEAGATLNSAALAAGIVDKMRVFYAPKVAGTVANGKGRTAGTRSTLRTAQELHDVTIETFGTDFSIEGYFRDVYRTR